MLQLENRLIHRRVGGEMLSQLGDDGFEFILGEIGLHFMDQGGGNDQHCPFPQGGQIEGDVAGVADVIIVQADAGVVAAEAFIFFVPGLAQRINAGGQFRFFAGFHSGHDIAAAPAVGSQRIS